MKCLSLKLGHGNKNKDKRTIIVVPDTDEGVKL